MNVLELHPEELIERSLVGELSADDQARLDSHLSTCAVCRFERQARLDFAAAPSPGLAVDDLVSRALAGMPAVEAPRRARRTGLRTSLAIAAALGAMASFAAVRGGDVLPAVVKQLLGLSAPQAPAPVAPAPPRRAPVAEVPVAEVPVAVPTADVVAMEEPVAVEETLPAPPAPVRSSRVAPRLTPAPIVAAPAERQVGETTPELPPAPVVHAGTLFSSANVARTSGRQGEAERLYRDLALRFPQSAEAKLSHALLGRLLLDTGDSRGALGELDAYLSSGDTALEEEALFARATTLGRLGQLQNERAAWERALESYPDGVHAMRARARLTELGASPTR